MDTLEVMTFDTILEDDLALLEFVLQNRDVKIITK
jgi:hypothetical protein